MTLFPVTFFHSPRSARRVSDNCCVMSQDLYRGRCGVGYFEYQDVGHHQRKFEETVELDATYGRYEKIVVPEFEESKKATILHDFEKVCL